MKKHLLLIGILLIFINIFIFPTPIVYAGTINPLINDSVNPLTKAVVEETVTKKLENEEQIKLSETEYEKISYKKFHEMVDKGDVQKIFYSENLSVFYFLDRDNHLYETTNPEYETFKKDILENGVEVAPISNIITPENEKSQADNQKFLYGSVVVITLIVLFAIYMTKKEQINVKLFHQKVAVGPKSGVRDDVKDDSGPDKKTFNDIVGLEEVKKDMQSLVDFIKNGDKYREAGAKLPKGVILYGPPGTGKTLLAKATATEAGVPFFYASGSDFIEKYVGVGAERIRSLFKKAKRSAPCVIFIDEIDAIGGSRNAEDNSGEGRKTINALLTEMDGFNELNNVLVMGATNRLEDLDSALMRAGRFTNKFCVPLPSTAKERKGIIEVYSKNKKYAEDVDFDVLAKETIGFSPAAIEALVNEAAIISVQDGKPYIDKNTIEKAMTKSVLNAHVRENQKDRDMEELRLVAYHEAGHALIGKLLGKEVNKVTILSSTNGAGGVTFTTPSKLGLHSISDLKDEVKQLYGGRVAEFLYYDGDNSKVTTGASNDIERATEILKNIVVSYGMTKKFGLINLSKTPIDNKQIMEEIMTLAKEIEEETKKMLSDNFFKLSKIANCLLDKETIYEKDLDEIITQI